MDLNPVHLNVLKSLYFTSVLVASYAGNVIVTSTFIKDSPFGLIQCAKKCLEEYSVCSSIYYSKFTLQCRLNYKEPSLINFVPNEYEGFNFFTRQTLQQVLRLQNISTNSCPSNKRRIELKTKTSTCATFKTVDPTSNGYGLHFNSTITYSKSVNVAAWKDTEQSSTVQGGVSSRAVDGNKNSVYSRGSCTHSDKDTEHWWRVNLAELYSIKRIQIQNRGDHCGYRLQNFRLYVGFERSNMDIVGFYNGKATDAEIITFIFVYYVKGRHVKIMMGGATELNLCEVEVYGTEINPNNTLFNMP